MRERIAFIFLILCIEATPHEYSFERITSENGLSQNNVLTIYQDSDGYMWFGTYDGVNRYDGYDFKVFRSLDDPNSLTSNLIRCLTEDLDNNIWVGSFDKGLTKYNRITDQFTRYYNTPDNPNLLTNNTIQHLVCDSKGNIWAATAYGINCLTPKPNGTYDIFQITQEADNPNTLSNNFMYTIFEDSKGQIWAGSNFGLDLMKKGPNGELTNEFYHLVSADEYWEIREIIEVRDGYVFTHYNGIAFIKLNEENPELSEIIPSEPHPSFHIQADQDGNIWAGGYNGLYRFERRQDEETPYVLTDHIPEGEGEFLLSNQFIRAIYLDNNGIFWFGTNGGGILKYNTNKIRFRHYKKTDLKGSLSHSKVFTVYEDNQHNVWIGTEGGGINLLTPDKEKKYQNGFISFDVNPPKQQNFVHDIINISNTGTPLIWAGTGYESVLVSATWQNNAWKIREELPELTHQIMVLHKDEFGTIWLGSYQGGLGKYVEKKAGRELIVYQTSNSNIPSNIIRNLYEDSKGRLWIGTNLGLMVLTREQKKKDSLEFTLFEHDLEDPKSISNSYTVPIIETTNGEIWVGTFGNGINRYIEGTGLTNGTFKSIEMDDGLPNNTIKHIIEDDFGNLWITSNKGLTRIDTSRTKIRNFSTHDGLQDLEFIDLSGYKLHDGEILFGGVNGFNAFYPQNILEDTIPPRIVFNDLEIMGKKVEVNHPLNNNVILSKVLNATDGIVLKHTQNNIKIFFSAIHYTAPKGNIFKYKLEGFDSDWTTTSAEFRFAQYTNLEIGRYTFMVHASNSDGLWTTEPKTLSIWIKPPIWLTRWFKILSAALALLIISSIIWFRFYLIKERNVFLEKEVDKRISEVKKKNKMLEQQTVSLNKSNKQLKERQEIIEEQSEELASQKEALERTNATKDKFYSILAHDLKGPFNALLGYLELLTNRINNYNSEKRVEKIKRAHDSANILYQFMQNLLQWSRVQRGIIPFVPVKTNIIDEINHVLSVYSGVIEEKGIKIKTNIFDKGANIVVDQNMFKTIIRNLISNAIKYSYPEGDVNIDVSRNNNGILVSVSDSGIGIPDHVIEKLFLIENKYSTEGTNNEKGTGLGLILCKEFVDMHQGKIWIESKKDEGTTVSFTLPFTEND